MAETNEDVAMAWRYGNSAKSGSMKTDGYTVWSYGTILGVTVRQNGRIVKVAVQEGRGSRTTSHHMNLVRKMANMEYEYELDRLLMPTPWGTAERLFPPPPPPDPDELTDQDYEDMYRGPWKYDYHCYRGHGIINEQTGVTKFIGPTRSRGRNYYDVAIKECARRNRKLLPRGNAAKVDWRRPEKAWPTMATLSHTARGWLLQAEDRTEFLDTIPPNTPVWDVLCEITELHPEIRRFRGPNDRWCDVPICVYHNRAERDAPDFLGVTRDDVRYQERCENTLAEWARVSRQAARRQEQRRDEERAAEWRRLDAERAARVAYQAEHREEIEQERRRLAEEARLASEKSKMLREKRISKKEQRQREQGLYLPPAAIVFHTKDGWKLQWRKSVFTFSEPADTPVLGVLQHALLIFPTIPNFMSADATWCTWAQCPEHHLRRRQQVPDWTLVPTSLVRSWRPS